MACYAFSARGTPEELNEVKRGRILCLKIARSLDPVHIAVSSIAIFPDYSPLRPSNGEV
jgi:hypothetical protein